MSKNRKKVIFTESDTLLIGLEKVAKTGNESARSLISWWLTNKSWTDKQWSYARHLVADSKRKKVQPKEAKFFLYAVSDGCAIKLGFTSNIGKRISTMQTGHPIKLELKWKLYTGKSREDAMKAEKKLHRFCRSYRLRGEWFKPDCLSLVNEWSL